MENKVKDNQQTTQNLILQELDQRVVLRFKKIKGKNKTCIYGLEKVLDKPKLEDFLKNIKKKLACGGLFTEDDDKIMMIEFMGDHREKIKKILIDEKIIAADKIDLKGA